MPEINFKISDGQKFEYLWSLLNPNYNEAGDYAIECVICDVYDEYAIVRNLTDNTFERVYYNKNDETDSLEITNRERCYIVDITEAEKEALDNLHTAAGATFTEINDNYSAQVGNVETLNTQIETLNGQITELNTNNETQATEFNAQIEALNGQISELNAQISDFVTKIAEHEASISTLNTENETLNASLATANETIGTKASELETAYSTITTLTQERDALVAYKNEIITNQKTAIVTSYAKQLPEDVINEFLTNLDNYALEQLDMILTYELKKYNPALFNRQMETTPVYVPKDDNGAGRGISDILAKYSK